MHFPSASALIGQGSSPLRVHLQHHPWQDPLLISIRDFQRPQALITPLPASTADNIAPSPNPVSNSAVAEQSVHAQPDLVLASDADFDKSVDLMLKALAHAVAVRCQCIDQHIPHLPQQQSLCAYGPAIQQQKSTVAARSSHNGSEWPASAVKAPANDLEATADTLTNNAANLHMPALYISSKDTGCECRQQASCPQASSLPQPEPSTQSLGPCGATTQQAQEALQAQTAHLKPAPVLILFSGGVDSTLIAALAHQSLPAEVPIDLASVCFNGGKSADRLAAQDALLELAAFAPGREWRLIQVDSSLEEVDQHRDWLLGDQASLQEH